MLRSFHHPSNYTNRITSYNVCYTKLLRFAWSPEYKLANSGVPQAKCQGVPLRLTIDAGLNNYQWSFKQSGSTGGFINLPGSDAQTNSVLVNPVADPSNNGDYKVVADDTYGCPVSDVVNVTVTATPPLSFPANQTICEGSTLKLLANAGYDSYAWTKDGVPQASNPLTGEVIISSRITSYNVCYTKLLREEGVQKKRLFSRTTASLSVVYNCLFL